jgi:single-stranded DNA-binding protein
MNSCNFTGRLVRDVEKRTLNNEKKTPTIFYTIAVQDTFSKDKAHFISCQSFGPSVDYLATNGKKGMYIEFSGQATTYSQKDDKGVARTNTVFVSDEVHLIYGNSATTAKAGSTEQAGTTNGGQTAVVEEDLPF